MRLKLSPLFRVSYAALAFGVSASSQAQWMVTNLHPAGAVVSYADGVGGGQVVGSAVFYVGLDPHRYALMWTSTGDSMVNLHPAQLYHSSWASLAANGRQGGAGWDGGRDHAGLWSGTAASFVLLDPYGSSYSYVFGMYGDYQCGAAVFNYLERAGIWNGTPGTWIDLHPGAARGSRAYGIWGTQQVGSVIPDTDERACLWNGTPASIVYLNPVGSTSSRARGVWDGTQTGFVCMNGQSSHAGIWHGTAASWIDMNPAGSTQSEAVAIDGDQQVGYASVGGVGRASLWSGSAASWIDLSQLVSGYSSTYATGIWHDGTDTYISGNGYHIAHDRTEALLWMRPGPNSFMLTLNKSKVAGQNSTQGTITMGSIKGTPTVFTTYDNSSLVTTPATVTVPAGQYSKNFQITNVPSTVNWPIVITAKLGGLVRTRTLTLTPLYPTAVAFLSNPIQGGNSTLVKVVINGVAGPNGLKLGISDDSTLTQVPSTITIPSGASSGTFTLTSSPVSSQVLVKVKAKNSAGEQSATLRLVP